jgi:hypothetical protein
MPNTQNLEGVCHSSVVRVHEMRNVEAYPKGCLDGYRSGLDFEGGFWYFVINNSPSPATGL